MKTNNTVRDTARSLLRLIADMGDREIAAMTINALSHYGGIQMPFVSEVDTSKAIKIIDSVSAQRELKWPTWAGEDARKAWADFIDYRRAEHKKGYASAKTEQRALDMATGWFPSEPRFCSALEFTMAKCWQFPVPPDQYQYPAPQQTRYTIPEGFTAPPMLTKDPEGE